MTVRRTGLFALRWFVWLLLAWVFLRGIVSFLPTSAASSTNQPPPTASPAAEPAGLRAFPAQFIRQYLTWSPTTSPEEYTQRIRPYLTPGMDPLVGWDKTRKAIGQRVESSWVYAVKEVSPTRWLVTLTAELSRYEQAGALPSATLYIAVPIGKTGDGGWVVYDYPTLVPPPPAGAFSEPLHYGTELTDEGDQVKALLSRFFQAYLSGSSGDLAYYLIPGTQVQAFKSPWAFESVSRVVLSKSNASLYALADVVLVDPVTGARYVTRYTTGLAQREGRWYVHEILQKGE